MPYIRFILIFLFLFCALPQNSLAAASDWIVTKEASVRLISSGPSKIVDGAFDFGLHFTMPGEWKTYWRTPGDGGVPVSIDHSKSENIERIQIEWPAPKRYVEYGTIESYGYKHEVVLPVVVVTKNASSPVHARFTLNYAVCDEICIFLTQDIELHVKPEENDPEISSLISQYRTKIADKNGEHGLTILEATLKSPTEFTVTASSESGFTKPDVFVESNANFRFPKPAVAISDDKKQATFTFAFETLLSTADFRVTPFTLTLSDGDNAVEMAFDKPVTDASYTAQIATTSAATSIETTAPATHSIFTILLFAFLGGLILNIMPCVLPVLSLKCLSLLKTHESKRHIRISFLSSSAGIIFSFLVLALIVSGLKSTGTELGWGFHFQESWFLVALIVIILLFSANLFGMFEISLPRALNDKLSSANNSSNHRILSDFMAGAFATLLATPCSAPFLGTAVSFALSQGFMQIMFTFLFMGFGLAAPYLTIAAYPGVARFFPKPGKWMLQVKYVLGVMLFVTALWLGYVLIKQLDVISPTELAKGSENYWISFDEKRIPTLISQGKVVFVDVTADWCLTCKANKLFVLDKMEVKELLAKDSTVAMIADYTKPSKEISDFLKKHGRYGIPFNIVYGPGAPQGIILPELLSQTAVIDALNAAAEK